MLSRRRDASSGGWGTARYAQNREAIRIAPEGLFRAHIVARPEGFEPPTY